MSKAIQLAKLSKQAIRGLMSSNGNGVSSVLSPFAAAKQFEQRRYVAGFILVLK